MQINLVTKNKKDYLSLLLVADESEEMIELYLERGSLFVMEDDGPRCVCVVTDEGDGVYEIQSIAVDPAYHRRGYGRRMIEYVLDYYRTQCETMYVGTGDTPATLGFYENCGFEYSHRLENYMLEHYPHPIIEDGVQLFDKVYLKKAFLAKQ